MKKTFLSLLTLVLFTLGMTPINATEKVDEKKLANIQIAEKIANIDEEKIPLDFIDRESWKEETKILIEEEYELPVLEIKETVNSIVFVLEEVAIDEAVIGETYVSMVEYTKPNVSVDTYGTSTKAARSTKFMESYIFGGTVLMKKSSFIRSSLKSGGMAAAAAALGLYTGHTLIVGVGEVLVSAIAQSVKANMPNSASSEINVYRQIKTTSRSGYVLTNSNVWQPTYIIHKEDYYSYSQGRIYYTNIPAVPFQTANKWYKEVANSNYYASQATYKNNALYYFNLGKMYLNGSVYDLW